ncbi:MAG: poly-beta,6-N-acetyl-D-glucosamine N-deacetylase [Baekduia sp.]|jgi:peptidoglycan/xylan/chitin deacetylase (PgdA/CDA1 family)|nr:poly-beta,6-N-acetyl-D-glucosamine N-deacetylase [Baekduia sp.]
MTPAAGGALMTRSHPAFRVMVRRRVLVSLRSMLSLRRALLPLVAVLWTLPGAALAAPPPPWRAPLRPVRPVLTPAERAQWPQVADYRDAVPVLNYHGLHNVRPGLADPYSITRAEFARQMAMLSRGGFHAITIRRYAAFTAGRTAGLPSRPILITFDDGRLDSYRGADRVLARYHLRATMFAITAAADARRPGYLRWSELARMARTRRWDIQEHAGAGHVLIPTGPRRSGPSYANLLWTTGTRETFTDFQRRVSGDILAARDRLAAVLPTFRPLGFAVPYGDYGQDASNYAPIAAWEAGWLQTAFAVVFVQDHRVFNPPGERIAQRYGVHATTTAGALHDWLVAGAAAAPTLAGPAATPSADAAP